MVRSMKSEGLQKEAVFRPSWAPHLAGGATGVTSQAALYAGASLLRGSSTRRVWLTLGERMASEWDPNTSVAVSPV